MAAPEDVGNKPHPLRRLVYFLSSVTSVRDRYVLQHYSYAYVVCAMSFLGIYIAAEVLSRIKKFLAPHGIPLWRVLLEYYSVMIPVAYTYYLGPVLTLSAAMFALTLLNKNNELMPLKAAGMSLYRIVAPIFGLGFLFAVLTFLSQEFLIPSLKDQIREVYGYSHRTLSRKSQVLIDGNTEFNITRYWPAKKRGDQVIVTYYRFSPEKGKKVPERQYVADYLHWEPVTDREEGGKTASPPGRWVLKEGKEPVREYLYDARGDLIVPEGETKTYKTYIRLTLSTLSTRLLPEDFEAAGENIQYLSLRDLKRQWARRPSSNHILVRIHQHWSFPFTHVVLLLLGLPFVLNQENRSVFLGVLVSIGICVAYYIVNAMCTELGSKGVLQPVVAAWLPVLFFAGLGAVLFDNLRT